MDIRWTQVGLTIDESYVVGWRSGGGGGRKEEGEGKVGSSVAWGRDGKNVCRIRRGESMKY